MKKTLLILAALAASCGMYAEGWEKPVYSGAYQALTPGDTVYIYNTEAKMFLTEGNDWGTHATVGDAGLQFVVNKYQLENEDGSLQEWDGKTYTISDNSIAKGGWKNMFITDGGGVFMDRNAQDDYLFSFIDKGNNIYNIIGAELNPTWNASGDKADYMIGHDTAYLNAKDGIPSGTGVIYDYYGEDNDYTDIAFNTLWTFVSQSDYAVYQASMEAYTASEELKALMDDAKAFGVDIAEAEKAYSNTKASAAELKSAIAALNTKILAYYETSVTPDNPKDLTAMIANAECNSIDGWSNGIGATTWNTQTWIGEGWEGFEGTTLNIWGATMEGTVSQTLTGIPNGIYVVNMAVYSEKMDGNVYANENVKTVIGASAGKTYQVTTEVTDGVLEFGFKQDEAATNWVAMDNATVMYYGSGVEAYRYWLNGLLESAPSFDGSAVQTALLERYEAVLASVNTVQTKDEILGIIPAYEAVLNEISTNIDAYNALKSAIGDAEALAQASNSYYGEQISDFVQETAQSAIEEHTLSTEEVNAVTASLKEISDAAQNYVWNMEKLASETEKAAEMFAEYGTTCSLSAADAYNDFVAKYNELNTDYLKNEEVLVLLDDLYAIEFNLQVPADPASDANPVDYTAKIYNPSFNGVDGWTNDGWSTFGNNTWYGFANEEGASSGDGNYLNLWHTSNARGYQRVTGLPAGAYTVQMGAFADKEGLQIYANENVIDVPAGQDGESRYMRLYTIDVVVGEDGVIEIGAQNTNGGEIWAMIDEVHLYYKGTDSEIMTGIGTVNPAAGAYGIFSLNGVKQSMMHKGINIVKMSDGTIQKVMIK